MKIFTRRNAFLIGGTATVLVLAAYVALRISLANFDIMDSFAESKTSETLELSSEVWLHQTSASHVMVADAKGMSLTPGQVQRLGLGKGVLFVEFLSNDLENLETMRRAVIRRIDLETGASEEVSPPDLEEAIKRLKPAHEFLR